MIQFSNSLGQTDYNNLSDIAATYLGYGDTYAADWVYGYDITGTAVANMSVLDSSVGVGANEGTVAFRPQVTWFFE